MKLILLKNIKKLGNPGDIVEVKSGYAMNFLIPQKIAVQVTQEKIRKMELNKEKKEKNKKQEIKGLSNLVNKISNKKIIIKKDASEKGKLFASVTQNEILTALKNNFKIDLSKHKIKLNKHIKKVGEHKVDLKIGKDKIQLIVNVITM